MTQTTLKIGDEIVDDCGHMGTIPPRHVGIRHIDQSWHIIKTKTDQKEMNIMNANTIYTQNGIEAEKYVEDMTDSAYQAYQENGAEATKLFD